jgi:DNA helicase IV
MRDPNPAEHHEIVEHEARVRDTERARSPCFAFLRIRTEIGTRDILLGTRSSTEGRRAIIDWRSAPLAEVFFAYQEGESFEIESGERIISGEVEARAVYIMDRGSLVEIERRDKRYLKDAAHAWKVSEGQRRFALAPARRSRRANATTFELDEHQKRLVDLPAERSVLVLGEAGFGKTTAAIHRLAAIVHRAEKEGRSLKSLVIVPTGGLERLSRLMLDRLDVPGAEVATFDDWILKEARYVFPHLPRRTSRNATAAVMRLKRHPALRRILPEIALSPSIRPRNDLLRLFGDRALMECVVETASSAIPRHAVREILEHTHIQFSATSEEEYAHVDRDRLQTLDGLLIDEGTPLEDARTIDPEDGAVLFEIHRLRTGSQSTRRGRLSQYDLIVVDEAQERAPIELAIIGRARRRGGSIIVAGDEHQQTDDTAYFGGWREGMKELGLADHETVVLEESHRSPPEVTRLARQIAGRASDDEFSRTTRSKRSSLIVSVFPSRCHLEARLIEEIEERRSRDPRATIAVICRNEAGARDHCSTLGRALPLRLVLDGGFDFRPGIVVTTVAQVKGLEFDVAVLPDADRAHYPETPDSRRALYVAVTRALDQVMVAAVDDDERGGLTAIIEPRSEIRAPRVLRRSKRPADGGEDPTSSDARYCRAP